MHRRPSARFRVRSRAAVVSATILAFAGCGLVFAGLAIYPDVAPLAEPESFDVTILKGESPFDTLNLEVVARGADDVITVGAGRYTFPGSYTSSQLDDPVGLAVLLPADHAPIGGCPRAAQCSRVGDQTLVGLVITPTVTRSSSYGSTAFAVARHGLGYRAGDSGARVVFPAVDTGGMPLTHLRISYPLRDAGRLVWSATPPSDLGRSFVEWDLDAASGLRSRAEDVASDPGAEKADSFALFLSGSLFALGTSAVLAIIPELVRLRHD